MKSNAAEKKKTLKLKVDKQIDFKLVGISSHENDYRLVWSINEQLNMQFIRIENLVIHNHKISEDFEFSRYLYHDEDRYLKLYLISNRCHDGFLFPEVKNLDFVLQIVGEMHDTILKEMVKKLKTVQVIATAFILAPEKIKGIGKILMEN